MSDKSPKKSRKEEPRFPAPVGDQETGLLVGEKSGKRDKTVFVNLHLPVSSLSPPPPPEDDLNWNVKHFTQVSLGKLTPDMSATLCMLCS